MLDLIQENFISLLCAGIAGVATGIMAKLYRKINGLIMSVMAMGHDDLFRYAEFYILTNEITVKELENLEHIYKGYQALGGNGTGTEIFEKCKELPVVDKRTKYNPYYTEREL